MKRFTCACGATVYFDNTLCLSCRRVLGFDPDTRELLALEPTADGEALVAVSANAAPGESTFQRCANTLRHDVCNWLVPAGSDERFCRACALNDIIPNLTTPTNLSRWKVLEIAKRRLVLELEALGLTVTREQMRFMFIEDQSSNPEVIPEYVSTGYHAGVITINVAEADDIRREEIRVALGERYRTVLGHFRHESGHCYWETLIAEGPVREQFRILFGDERQSYSEALARHYAGGVSAEHSSSHITPYATMHPWEDWAECWCHFLHIRAALISASEAGWIESPNFDLEVWAGVAVRLNEVARSLGVDDPYPFVITPRVAEKITFVRQQIEGAGPSA